MTDNYRISDAHDHPSADSTRTRPTAPTTTPTDAVDTWLWVAIVVSLVANVLLSLLGHDILGIPCGLVVIGAAVALVVRRKGRTR